MSTHPVHRFFTRPSLATIRALVAGVNTAMAMLTVFSAWGGIIDPSVCVMASLAAMALPILLGLDLMLIIADLILWRKAVVVILLSWIVSLPPLLDFSPLNLPRRALNEARQERSFTFLTYNVLNLWDFRGQVKGLDRNATIDYILEKDADIVSLQEVTSFREWPLWNITAEQLREMSAKYPFRYINPDEAVAVFSKYPFVKDRIEIPQKYHKKFYFFRISMRGQVLHLANCHLQSIGLSPEDKQLYRGLIDRSSSLTDKDSLQREVNQVKTQLLSKLQNAFIARADQARFIRNAIDSIGGNWIVAGDFNDIPDCYAVRTIMDGDMHDAYADCAFGPSITYHDKMFYFRIDQVLYKGSFKAWDIRRDRQPSSDHYPLLTTFVFDDEEELTPPNKSLTETFIPSSK